MRISRVLLSVAASAAFLGGANAVLFAQDEPVAVASSGAVRFDESLLDVKDGEKAAYYQERLEALQKGVQEALGGVAQIDAAAAALLNKVNAAAKACYKNLAEAEDASETDRNMAFARYAGGLVGEGKLDELKALQKKYAADVERAQMLGYYVFVVRFQSASQSGDDAELAKIGDELIAAALADEAFAGAAAQLLARTGVETLKKASAAFEKSDSETLKRVAASFGGKIRFADLVGKEMKVEGVYLDGEEIDWKSYRGKVVLVDFWATWCGPCVAEVPNVLSLYKKYNAAGFEAIGYSLDDDLDALKKFEEERKLPWKTASRKMSQEAEKDYVDLTQYYGINAIPTMILVGKDGKVIDTNARGARLQELLEKAFPEVK